MWKNILLNCPTMAFLDNKLFQWKKVTQMPMPFMFYCSTIPVVLEMHIHLSCCLRCLMKVIGICNKINFKLDSYSSMSCLICFQKKKSE